MISELNEKEIEENEAMEVYDLAWSDQYTQRQIAEMYGISRTMVSDIKFRRKLRRLWDEQQNENEKLAMED